MCGLRDQALKLVVILIPLPDKSGRGCPLMGVKRWFGFELFPLFPIASHHSNFDSVR